MRTLAFGRDRWPPPQPIAPSGLAASLTVAACLVLAGAGTFVLAWNELTCTVPIDLGPERTRPASICDVVAGIGGVAVLLGACAVAAGVAILLGVRGREVSHRGSDAWRWALGLVFTIGGLILVTRLPSQTCPGGADLSGLFHICIDHEGGRRFDSTDWVWAKALAACAIPIVGFAVVARRRFVALAVPLTLAVWVAGVGWLLLDTIGRDLLPA